MSGVMHISGLPARTVGELMDALDGTHRDVVIEWWALDDEGGWGDVTRFVSIEVSPTSSLVTIDYDADERSA